MGRYAELQKAWDENREEFRRLKEEMEKNEDAFLKIDQEMEAMEQEPMHLQPDAAEEVLDGYGMERVVYVLSSSIRLKEQDGRFSRENKEWAKTMAYPLEV